MCDYGLEISHADNYVDIFFGVEVFKFLNVNGDGCF